MMEERAHGLAQARAEKLLTRRTPSVASGLSKNFMLLILYYWIQIRKDPLN